MSAIDNKPFVKAWVEAYNKRAGVPQVAKALNTDIPTVSRKANYLRKKGVNLPHMLRDTSILNVDALNSYIDRNISQ